MTIMRMKLIMMIMMMMIIMRAMMMKMMKMIMVTMKMMKMMMLMMMMIMMMLRMIMMMILLTTKTNKPTWNFGLPIRRIDCAVEKRLRIAHIHDGFEQSETAETTREGDVGPMGQILTQLDISFPHDQRCGGGGACKAGGGGMRGREKKLESGGRGGTARAENRYGGLNTEKN